jgi:hypothetical protein
MISPTGDVIRAPTFDRPELLPARLLIILRASFVLNVDSSAHTYIVVVHLDYYSLNDYKRIYPFPKYEGFLIISHYFCKSHKMEPY